MITFPFIQSGKTRKICWKDQNWCCNVFHRLEMNGVSTRKLWKWVEKTSEVVAVVAAVGFVDRDNQQEAAKQSVKRSHFTVRFARNFFLKFTQKNGDLRVYKFTQLLGNHCIHFESFSRQQNERNWVGSQRPGCTARRSGQRLNTKPTAADVDADAQLLREQ